MYNMPYFKENDTEILLNFIKKHPFAFMSGADKQGKPVATQLPVILLEKENKWFVQGHMMRNTDHHKAFVENPQVLLVFTGPQAYVSASWYSEPHQGSTWNYMSIHLQGEIRFLEADELVDFMCRFTLYYENGNTNSPTVYDNLPADYSKQMMPAITGFEMEIKAFKNVFKLSQNRDLISYNKIIQQLTNQGGQAAEIAKEMLLRKKSLFKLE